MACRRRSSAASPASMACWVTGRGSRSVPINSICSESARSIRLNGIWSAIDEFGVGVLIRRVIEKVKARNGVLHVSFDVDFLDPEVAPGVGTTVPGGTTYREA